jgi:hypothetical protein
MDSGDGPSDDDPTDGDEQEPADESPDKLRSLSSSSAVQRAFRVSPELNRNLQRMASEALRYSGAVDRAREAFRFSPAAEQTRQAVKHLTGLRALGMDTMVEQIRRQVAVPLLDSPQWQQAMERMRTSLRRYWPENWHDLGAHDIEAVMTTPRMTVYRWCGCPKVTW